MCGRRGRRRLGPDLDRRGRHPEEIAMTTIQTKVRNGLVTTALAGCVVLVSAPANGAVAPEPDQPAATGQLSKAAIEHYEADTTGTTSVGGQLSKAAIEHYEADTT